MVLKESGHKEALLIKDVTGVILAGGKSSRFGKNKALVKVGGTPLIERVIMGMGAVFKHLVLITNTPDEYAYLKLPMYEDLIKGLGPLGGILTALDAIETDKAFFVACDMPFINQKLIRYIVEISDDFNVVLPRINGEIEPLYALYNRRCLPAIKKIISAHQYQILQFFDDVSLRYVEENEIRRFDPELRSFFNINIPRELKEYQKMGNEREKV